MLSQVQGYFGLHSKYQGSHGYVGPSLMQKKQTNTNLSAKKDSFQNHVEGMELVASILSKSGSFI